MSEKWIWWVGSDPERFHTSCLTRDEAVQIAINDYDGAYIIEAIPSENIKLSDYFNAGDFIETANEAAYDLCDPEGYTYVFDTHSDTERELQEMVRAAIDAWQQKHELKFVSGSFQASRNLEYIRPPDPERECQGDE
jgi:hypothetical protein